MNAFWALVKNDIKLGSKFTSKKFKWFLVYFIAAVLLGIVQYTVFLLNAKDFSFDPRLILPIFLFVFILISGQIISNEKRRDTIGWWLTLPYPRKMLLGAKITASFIRFLKSVAAIIITVTFLFLEALLIRPDLFSKSTIENFFMELMQLIILLVAFSPFSIMFGIIFRLVGISKWRPAVPLFWISVPLGFSFIMSVVFNHYENQPFEDKINLIFNSGIQRFSLLLLLEAVLVIIIYLVSKYIFENQVEA